LLDQASAAGRPSFYPSVSTILRTGRLLAPSISESSSTRPGRPPQPSCALEDVADRHVALFRVHLVQHAVLAAVVAVIRMNNDGKARNGSSSASAPVGSGSVL
jgi:hypothetical protein